MATGTDLVGLDTIDDFTTPWTRDLTVRGGDPHSIFLSVSTGSDSTGLTCSVTVDGKKILEDTASGEFQSAKCPILTR